MLQRIVFALVLAAGAGAAIAAENVVPEGASQEFVVGIRVDVDAAGKVTSATANDPAAVPAMNQAGLEIARKLAFDPATQGGAAVSSETTLFLTLALEQKADGTFAIRLRKASNGPYRSNNVGTIAPEYTSRRDRAMVVVSVSVRADGTPDMETFKGEDADLSTPSKFAEARYLDSISTSMRGTRFALDKVAGTVVPVRMTMPYKFGGGGGGRRGEKTGAAAAAPDAAKDAKAPKPVPDMKAESLVAGVTLPKVRFTAPPAAPAAAK